MVRHDDTGSRAGPGYKSYTGHGWSNPGYKGWSGTPNVRKHDLIGYSEVRNAKSYSSQTQQVVEVRRAGEGANGWHDDSLDYSPRITDGSNRGNQHHLLNQWLDAAPKMHELDHEDSPKLVNVMAHTGGPMQNSPHNRVKTKPRDHGKYEYPSDDEYNSDGDSDSDNESMHSRRHGSKVRNYPMAHERPNGHNRTHVNPNVPIIPYYESRPLAADPPRIKTGAARDHFYKKSTPQTTATPPQRKGKGQQGIISSSEARRRYGGMVAPTEGYSQEHYTNPIDCREAAEKYNGVFVPGNKF